MSAIKKERTTTKKTKKDEKVVEEAPKETKAPPPQPAEDPKKDEAKKEEQQAKPAKRGTSNVFALFNQSQIQEFKEAFAMMDQNRDGIIDEHDLAAIYQQIGGEPNAKIFADMLEESPGALNFTLFLGLFGEKLKGTDQENTLRDAFAMFDSEGKGVLAEEYVKDLLLNVGDQFTADEIRQTWKEAPIEGGQLNYLKFVRIMKRGQDE